VDISCRWISSKFQAQIKTYLYIQRVIGLAVEPNIPKVARPTKQGNKGPIDHQPAIPPCRTRNIANPLLSSLFCCSVCPLDRCCPEALRASRFHHSCGHQGGIGIRKKDIGSKSFFRPSLDPSLPPSIKGRSFPPLAAVRSFRSCASSPPPPRFATKFQQNSRFVSTSLRALFQFCPTIM
jgi:hypothetical protein